MRHVYGAVLNVLFKCSVDRAWKFHAGLASDFGCRTSEYVEICNPFSSFFTIPYDMQTYILINIVPWCSYLFN